MTSLSPIAALSILLFSVTLLSSASANYVNVAISCLSFVLEKFTWQDTYFEPTILPPDQQNNTVETIARSVRLFGYKCGDKLRGTGHTLHCFPMRMLITPPKPTRFVIVFLHGVKRPRNEGVYLPFLNQLLLSDPELASYTSIEYPLSAFRKLTFGDFATPSVPIGRSWIDTRAPPASDSLADVLASPDFDRLGLYRTAQRVSRSVRSQACVAYVPVNRVLLLGHSQGAFATLETVLSTDLQLAGAIAIAGALPRPADYIKPDTRPVFNPSKRAYNLTLIHGNEDKVVPFIFGNLTAQIVEPVVRSTGAGFKFEVIQGADHSTTLFNSTKLYVTIRAALRNAFLM